MIAADARVRLGHRDAARVRPRDELDRRWRHRRRPALAPAPAAPIRRQRRRSSTTRPSSARSPTCRASRCRRSAACSCCSSGYIVLVGPVNYLVLRWLDRREWAWVTVPVLIAVFTVGLVRDRGRAPRLGRDRQRGRDRPRRPGHGRGHRAVVPRRSSARRGRLPAPRPGRRPARRADERRLSGGGDGRRSTCSRATRRGSATSPSGSARCARSAPRPARPAPRSTATCGSTDGHIKGTVTNGSDRRWIAPALVLGSSATILSDIAPGQSANVDLTLTSNAFNGQRAVRLGRRAVRLGRQPRSTRRSSGSSSGARSSTSCPTTRTPGSAASCRATADAARLGQRPGRAGRARRRAGAPRGQRPVRGPAAAHGPRQHDVLAATCCAATRIDVSANFFSQGPVEHQLRDRRRSRWPTSPCRSRAR